MLFVGLGVLDVERRVRDVEIAAQYRLLAAVRGLVAQLAHASEHRVQKTVLLFHLGRIIGVAGVHVHAGHGDRVSLRRLDIGLNPTAGIHILAQARKSIAFIGHLKIGEEPDSGTTLDTADLVQRMQVRR